MEKESKFRLRLNLFDGIVLALALAVGCFLLWNAMKPQAAEQTVPEAGSVVRFTVRIQRWAPGTGSLIQLGDTVADNIKNYSLGQVVDVRVEPYLVQVLDEENNRYVWTELEGYEDVLLTLETMCVISDSAILVDGGYELRVGNAAYLRGLGYMGSGPIIAIEEVEK